MSVHLLQIVEPEFGDGDGGGEEEYLLCPFCDSSIFRVLSDLTAECLECGEECNLVGTEDA